MTTRYVALDTETTGLDQEDDEIIEVAVIAFDLDGVLGEYHSLVRPGQLPSYHIERLTGIQPSELAKAPGIFAIATEIAEFIGDSPIVGQSIGFDMAFLARAGVHPPAPVYDTFGLAQMLLPGLSDYSLRGLTETLGIEFPLRHRAHADAEAARLVFLALRQRLTQLPRWMLHELETLASFAEWPIAHLLREINQGSGLSVDLSAGLTADLLAPVEEAGKPLAGGSSQPPAAASEVVSLLKRSAMLTSHFPAFESRPEQEQMAAAVSTALTEGHNLMVEAGTGTGKSMAYLLPAALHALRRRERVVVSTDTIGLQEQLIDKDLPAVAALLAGSEEEPLRFAALKGRRNYLCLQRWTAARHLPPLSKEDAMLQARLLVWLAQTQTGDRAELSLFGPSYDVAWARLSSENTACLQNGCPFVRQGTCFLSRARRRAEAAHVLVVNHALLLSDLAAGGHVLPAYDHLIIDEAHNLEEEATSRFSFSASEGTINDLLDRVGRRSGAGLAGALVEAVRGGSGILAPGAYLAGMADSMVQAANRARQRLADPFRLLLATQRDHGPPGDSDGRLLITRSIRVQPIWSQVEIAAENLDAALSSLLNVIESLRSLLESSDQGLPNQDVLAAEVTDLWQQILALQQGLARTLMAEDTSLICWIERGRNTGEIAVCSAPLDVAETLRQALFEAKQSVILTSATLSAGNSFEFLRERLGVDEAEELLLGSPFDYASSTLILLPDDLPEPNEGGFVDEVSELLTDACRASRGRALVLFTSHGMLRGVYERVKAGLEAEGILVLGQGIDGSPRQMLSALRENSSTVLLGAASFWEGVDVVGEALSLLVIVRLPFAVPSDPVYQARSALYDEPFDQYALPLAVLRFRQGFGRLIRSKTDRGVLLVLDRRIQARRYGDIFLNSLPACSSRQLVGRDVAGAIETWLA